MADPENTAVSPRATARRARRRPLPVNATSVASVLMRALIVTTVLVVTLLAVSTLNRPHASGLGSLRPVAMQRSLDLLDKARAALRDTAPLPCDGRGFAR